MKFKCFNCSKEWTISKEKLAYIKNWPNSCPDCGSVDISHERFEKMIVSPPVTREMKK